MIAEYIWIGGNLEIRSKTRILPNNTTVFPEWNFDGSSTEQASGEDSEVIIKPQAVFPCPFRKGPNKIILCDTYYQGNPHSTNTRNWAQKIFEEDLDAQPWFGLEQEYFIMDKKTGFPLGVKPDENIIQGQYYCSNGGLNAYGRDFVEEHMNLCLEAGLKISGVNAEVAPGQWEFQIGPAVGIEAGDHLLVARFLLERLSEKYGYWIELAPKPYLKVNGSGCHCNYSTALMREGTNEKTGLEIIDEAINKLSLKHDEHMKVYGEGNEERMTGKHETASYDKFTFGRANRGASVRIGNETIDNQKGYFEDRRPASNCDPYLVTAMIFKTTHLE